MRQAEIEAVLDTMQIVVDTREHRTAEAVKRWEAFGVPYRQDKLDFGDYGAEFDIPGFGKWICPAVVERKMSLTEICGNFFQHRDRFVREFERATAAGFKIYLLIEGESWEAAYAGRYRSRVLPQCLVASLTAWMARYNCVVLFCTARTAPKLIKELLYREAKESFTKHFKED